MILDDLRKVKIKVTLVPKSKKGSKIHIKKLNRGKFTEYCKGKVTLECINRGKNSPDPKIRKRATFAENARKWKHLDGGKLNKDDNQIAKDIAYTTVQLLDPTGISSYPEVYEAGKLVYSNPNLENIGNLGISILGALPVIGKIGKGIKLAKGLSKLEKIDKTLENTNKAIDTLPELVPFLRKPTLKILNISSKGLEKLFSPKNYNTRLKINTGVNVINTSGSVANTNSLWKYINSK